jgi:hypothetical protein
MFTSLTIASIHASNISHDRSEYSSWVNASGVMFFTEL